MKTINDYINSAPKGSQKKLKELYKVIKAAAKDADEGIKWSMPAFYKKRILVMFGGFKDHVSIFPTPSAIKHFKKDLKNFKTSPGTIQFQLGKPLPKALIKKITAFRVKEESADKKWKTR